MNLKEEKRFELDTKRLVENEIDEKTQEIAALTNLVKGCKTRIQTIRKSIFHLRENHLPMTNSFLDKLNSVNGHKG